MSSTQFKLEATNVVVLNKPISGNTSKVPLTGYEFIVKIKGTIITTVFSGSLSFSEMICKLIAYFLPNSKKVLSMEVFKLVISPLNGESKGKDIAVSLFTILVWEGSKCHSVT